MVKSKNRDFCPNCKNMEVGLYFSIFKARLAFTQLKQAFIEAPIVN